MEINTTSIVIIILQVLIGVVLANNRTTTTEIKESIKTLFHEIKGLQSKEGCREAHASHNKIHEMEQEQKDKDIAALNKDIDNVAEIARRGNK